MNSLKTVGVTINGTRHQSEFDPRKRLSELLRDELGLSGTKIGCDAGDCGACTVLVDEAAVCACLTPAGAVVGSSVESVEGLANSDLGRSIANSFAQHGAAQCGFCTPGMLMAAYGLLQTNPDPTRDQVVESLAGVLCRCTGYQKIVEAVLHHRSPPVEPEVTVGKIVGERITRVDAGPKVNGAERFGADAIPADALRIQVVRSPHDSADFEFGALDEFVAQTEAVAAVVTAKDIPGTNRFGVIPGHADQPVLAEDHARFFGEAVAMVVGRDIDSSVLDSFPISWSPRPSLLNTEDALRGPAIHDHAPDNVLVRGYVAKKAATAGEIAATATGSVTTSFVEHAYIEPEAGWAEQVDGEVVVHVTTQAPYMDREATAEVLGISPEAVRVVPTGCGGGFGGKLDISVQPLLGLAALVTGRPCGIVYTRPESIISTTKRHPASMTVTASVDGDGLLQSFEFDGTFNTGAYASWGPTVANRVPIHAGGPYRQQTYRAETTAVYTNCAPAGAFRGFGVPQAAIARETVFDDLADELGIDQLTFRQRNALEAGQATATGQVFPSAVGIGDCLESLRTPWEQAKERAEQLNREAGPIRRGVGVASAWYGCGNTALPNPSTVRIGLRADGRFVLHQGATDIGQGSNTVMTQIAADGLGVSIGDIVRVGPDTAVTPDAGKTSASRQTYVSGNATFLAAAALRDQILVAASVSPADRDEAILECTPEGLRIRVAGRERELPGDLTAAGGDGSYLIEATESYDPPTKALDEDGQGDPYAVFGFGAQVVEVDVDTVTGRTTVANVVAAYDVGRAINPTLVEGQIEGGVAQGIGLALMEEFVPGKPSNLHDYLIPTIGDMPPVTSILIESSDPLGPYGAKGIGEHALIPTAPAVLNAIRNACGAKVRHVPATPEVVLQAIRESNVR